MKLSVVILNYKVPYHLMLCLQSAQKAIDNIPAEIIVVDNNSKDESCQFVQQHFPEVILVENPENEGFSKGNNHGIKIAKGEYICLLNPDTLVGEAIFENLLKFAETHPDFGAIGPKLIDGTGNFLPESKRNVPTPKVAFQKFLGNGKNYYANQLGENETGKVPVMTGACLLMKKSRYLEIGGLDEDYFMYGEDIDLCYSLEKSGYSNYYLGTESVLHFKGESTLKDAKYAQRFFGAMKLFYQKHFKSHFAMDLVVNAGVWFAQARKFFQPTKKQPLVSKPQTYLISKHNTDLDLKFSTEKKLKTIDPNALQGGGISNSRFIFDAESLAFTEIINLMEQHKNKQNSFRIKPAGFEFFIGSDSSAEKGEVGFIES